jgi:hypothetical protein
MRRAGWCLAGISGQTGCSRAQPDDQRGGRRRAEVDVAALVEAGGDRAELLELVDHRFDGVALLVAFGVEARWPPSAQSFASAGGSPLVGLSDEQRERQGPPIRHGVYVPELVGFDLGPDAGIDCLVRTTGQPIVA